MYIGLYSQGSPVIDLTYIRVEFPIKHFASDGHLQLVKRILHDIIGVQIIDPSRGYIHVCLCSVGEDQELGARHGVKALQAKVLRLHNLETRSRFRSAGDAAGRCDRRGLFDRVEAGGNGVNTAARGLVEGRKHLSLPTNSHP